MTENLHIHDVQILEILQKDATRSLESISEEIGVSLNTCWRRVRKLEIDGILERRVALVDNTKIGLPMTVFVSACTNDHSKDWADRFAQVVSGIPEIVEFYRLAGDVDYILKIMVGSMSDYDRVYKDLISKVSLSDVSARFAMEKLKSTTELPIRQALKSSK